MKKRIVMTHTQLNDKTKTILFDGVIDVKQSQDEITFTYFEADQKSKVLIQATPSRFHIVREGEMYSTIPLSLKELTEGKVLCEYGELNFSFYMREYFYFPHLIALEYDVYVDGEISESIRIVCKIKEVEA